MTDTATELRLDLFPATVIENPGTPDEFVHHVTRLLVGRDEIWVWEMRDGVPQLAVNDRYEEISGRRTTGWTATMSDGSTLFFRRASGCGCGNPLRGWSPPFWTVQIEALQ